MSETIERWAGKLGIKSPNLTHSQMGLPIVQRIMLLASVLGIAFGCLLGMIPLLFLDTKQMKHGEIVEVFEKHDYDDSHHITLASAMDSVRGGTFFFFSLFIIISKSLKRALLQVALPPCSSLMREFEHPNQRPLSRLHSLTLNLCWHAPF